jgi:hypothetical protein
MCGYLFGAERLGTKSETFVQPVRKIYFFKELFEELDVLINTFYFRSNTT